MRTEKQKTVYEFTIPIRPKAKARARKGANNNFYTPDNTVGAQTWIKQRAILAGCKPIGGPITLTLWFIFALKDIVEEDETRPHFVKPDLDNIIKLVKDALSGIAYKDDCQVCDLHPYKRWGIRDEIYIEVKPWIEEC